jgi:integrative and conjugative element protein (TIGR02256 family)
MRKPLGKVWLASSVLSDLEAAADFRFPQETGGVLMGYWIAAPMEVVITAAIGPGPNAIHRRYGFRPDHAFQVEAIEKIYETSGRLETYLGDWHSHPLGAARLSRTDLRTMSRISRTAKARASLPLMLLLNGSLKNWAVTVWCCRRRICGLIGTTEVMNVFLYDKEAMTPGTATPGHGL